MPEEIVQLHFTEEDLRRDGGRALHQFGVLSTFQIHSHDFYELFLVPRGSAVHVVNGQSQILTAGSFVLVRPWDVHKYEALSRSDLEIVNIGIPYETFLRLCSYLNVEKALFDGPELPLHRILSGALLADVEQKLLMSGKTEDREAGYRYILSVLPYLVELFLSAPVSETVLPDWLSDLLGRMEAPDNLVAGLPRMVELSGLSQEHLTRSFRRYLGMTPTEYINAGRLNMAAELLLTGSVSAIDVGGICGFNSQSHFYRLFTQRYGSPPKAFRTIFRNRYFPPITS